VVWLSLEISLLDVLVVEVAYMLFLIGGRAAQRNALPGQDTADGTNRTVVCKTGFSSHALGIFLPPVEEEGTTSP